MQRSWRWWIVAFASILALATALRWRGMQRWSLNNDEVCEVSWTALPFTDMMREVRRDAVHPPFDYLVQWTVSRFHGDEWTRRLPPVIAGIATVGLLMLLGRMWFSPAAGLLAGVLLAFSPIHIRYSQEVRPYSLALMLIAASLVALEMFAIRPRRRWIAVWAVFVFLAGATLYFAGMVAAVTGFFRIFVERKSRMRPVWKALPWIILVWTLAYSPWFPVLRHASASEGSMKAERLDWPWWKFRLTTFADNDYEEGALDAATKIFWAAVLIGAAASLWRKSFRPAVIWLIVCGALQMLVLQIRPHYSDPRYLLSSLPAAYLLAGAGVAVLASRPTTMPFGAITLLFFTGFSSLVLQEYYRGSRPDWRDVMLFVHDRARPGDTVVLTNGWVMRNFGYYWMTVPEPPQTEIHLFVEEPKDLVGPAWIVTGQCRPRAVLKQVGLMHEWRNTELAEVRFLRAGERMSEHEPICPE